MCRMSGDISVLSSFDPDSHQEQRKNGSKIFSHFVKAFSNYKLLVYHFIQNLYPLLRYFFAFSIEHCAYLLRLVPKRSYTKLFYPIVEELVLTTKKGSYTPRKKNVRATCL